MGKEEGGKKKKEGLKDEFKGKSEKDSLSQAGAVVLDGG
jgi:hypothetical protein